ncbi:MAG TPA: autotransporter domain-containing protein, partial [Steroidobacteraceae bacterium]|nr:autotransporter domain-containing protein [Steroidobacteraceae bacterium]
TVTVTNHGSILTHGDGANGIYAQSIGGGGGNAGMALQLTSGLASNLVGGILSAALGGHGGSGGLGGLVIVQQYGDVTVLGNNAQAVVAESINGGGGHVALDFDGISSLPGGAAIPGLPAGTDSKPVFTFNIGGSSEQDSDAGRVILDYKGTFGAAGRNGAASSAQSIGGGGGTYLLNLGVLKSAESGQLITLEGTLGGSGGLNNSGGAIGDSQVGNLVTAGDNTPGLLLQSVGGGGGRASLDVSAQSGTLGAAHLTLGGSGGTNEQGGSVSHTQAGSVATGGAAADGALLQSIGGGGGAMTYLLADQSSAAAAASEAVAHMKLGTSTASAKQAPDPGADVSVTLGSSGGTRLDGGAIALNIDGDVATGGDSAQGLVLQSIGAGGGKLTALGAGGLAVALGGSAGASGNGADITVSHVGTVYTSGVRSHGVFLQSIGGGGGAVFTDVANPEVAVSSANAGNGGAISFTQVGDVRTDGAGSYGLVAQSIGGGGGFVDGAFKGSAGGAGLGGTITLDVDGNLVTAGAGSTALFAQSAGGAGGGDVSIALTKGHQLIGGAGGVAVQVDGGANNTFENFGTVATLSGLEGLAFFGGGGNETIVNHGAVVGDVDLGGGANQFQNQAGATFYAGSHVNLGGPGNLLSQNGLFAPGGVQHVAHTQLDGGFRQSAGGTSAFDLDFAANAVDSLVATGTVQLSGRLEVTLMNVGAIRPGEFEKVVFYGGGGLTDQGLLLNAPPSIVIHYGLSFPDAKTAELDYDVDFAPTGLVGNRVAIGEYINRVQAAGSSPALADTIATLVGQTELDPYSLLLTELGPEAYAEQQALAIASIQWFTRVMQDCGSYANDRFVGERPDCAWGLYDYSASTRDTHDGFPSSRQTANRFSAGYQRSLDGDWVMGFGVDFEHGDSHGFDGRWKGEATDVQFGLAGRRVFGATSVGGVLNVGNSHQDVHRSLAVTEPVVASGERDVPFLAAVLDVTHRYVAGGVGISPALSLGLSSLFGDSMTEKYAGAQDLALSSHTDTRSWLEPSVAFDFERSLANNQTLRLYGRLGALYYLSQPSTEVVAGFAVAPHGAAPMVIGSDLGRTQFLGEFGVELYATDRYMLSVSYGRQGSDIRTSDSGTARITVPLH